LDAKLNAIFVHFAKADVLEIKQAAAKIIGLAGVGKAFGIGKGIFQREMLFEHDFALHDYGPSTGLEWRWDESCKMIVPGL
jgi:hypothetical protein